MLKEKSSFNFQKLLILKKLNFCFFDRNDGKLIEFRELPVYFYSDATFVTSDFN